MSGAVAYELLRPRRPLCVLVRAHDGAAHGDDVPADDSDDRVRRVRCCRCSACGAWALPPPASGDAGAVCFMMSLTATVALASAITMLMHVALIWTLSGRGFNTRDDGHRDRVFRPRRCRCRCSRTGCSRCCTGSRSAVSPTCRIRIYSGNIDAHAAVFEIAAAIRLGGADRRRRLCADGIRRSRASWCRAAEMRDALQLYGRMIGLSIRAQMQYRASFLLMSRRTFHHHRRRDVRHLGAVRPVRQPHAVDAAAGRVLLWDGQHQFRVHRRAGARLRSVRRAIHQDRQFRSPAAAAAQHGAAARRPRIHAVSRRATAAGRDRAASGRVTSSRSNGTRRGSRCSRSRCSRRSCSSMGW